MRFLKKNGIYTCPAWAEFTWQTHGFGTRDAAYPSILTLRQIHSAEVRLAGDFADRQCEGDALVACEAGRAIGVRTADCVPILLLDSHTRSVAAVHAGWRGTAARIVFNAIAESVKSCGSAAADLHAAIGPCIRPCCYEVSEEVAARFPLQAVRNRNGARPHLDLAFANKQQLVDAGLPDSHIDDCELCTCCLAEDFFSYRREPANPGRMLSFIARIL